MFFFNTNLNSHFQQGVDYFSVFINNDTNIDSKMGGGSNLFGGRAAAPLAPLMPHGTFYK